MSATTVRPPSFVPRTFLDWGVAVPFTTPLLSSGRVRPGRRGRPRSSKPSGAGRPAAGVQAGLLDQVRIVEILFGPDAALQLYDEFRGSRAKAAPH